MKRLFLYLLICLFISLPVFGQWNKGRGDVTKAYVDEQIAAVGAGGISDGDKGDVVVSGSGTIWSIDGLTTIGSAMLKSTNPGAIRFGRANADNTFSWLSDSDFRTAVGAEPADAAIEKTDENEVITGTREFQGGAKIDGYLQLFDTCLASAPVSPIDGAFYCADKTNWDQINYSGSVPYIVQYDGSGYIGIIDRDGNEIVAPEKPYGQTDASGDITMIVNAVNYGTDTGDADIPDGACDGAEDVFNWVVLISSAADAYALTSNDASNQFVIAANAAALTAGNELDVDGTMVCVMCIAPDLWKVTGYMGAIPTDGGAAD